MTESPLLRSYQLQGIKQMCDRRHTLLADEPGLGKTAQVIGVINELELRRVLVICPASVKVNWVRELHKWLTTQREIQIIKNKVSTVEPWAEIVVVNYDLVIHSNIFNQLKNNQWQLLVCDECFLGDTQVETFDGPKNIKDIKIGDRVKNALGWSVVTHTSSKTLDNYVRICYDSSIVNCSRNHLWLTTRGWVKAHELRTGDSLIYTDEACKIMRDMQNEVFCSSDESEIRSISPLAAFLREILFCEVENGSTRGASESTFPRGVQQNIRGIEGEVEKSDSRNASRSSAEAARSNARTEPITDRKNKKYSQRNEMGAYKSLRERNGANEGRAVFTQETREDVAMELYCPDTDKKSRGLSNSLQTGFSTPWVNACNRDRRVLSFSEDSKAAGHEKNPVFKTARVDSVTFHQSTGGSINGTDIRDNIFYDLTVEGHPSFSVNGVIVHNSHYLKNMKAERTTAVLGAGALAHKAQRTIMVTGTPVLNRPIELYPMLKVLCPAVIGAYKDYYKYAMRYCNAWYDAFSFNVNGASHTDELNAALRKYYMIRRTLSEVETQIPARQYQMWFIEPSLKVKTKMQLVENAVRKDFQYQNLNLEGGELATVRRETAESKIESCIEHIHDRINECGKLVIFAYHHSVIQNLQKQLSKYKPVVLDGSKSQTQRQAAIDSFVNDPSTQVFIGQIQAAGQGIDGLQLVCNHVMFLEWSWVPGEIEQAMKRVQRMGQTKTTFVEFIVWSDSVEEHMMRTALDKVQVIREVVK